MTSDSHRHTDTHTHTHKCTLTQTHRHTQTHEHALAHTKEPHRKHILATHIFALATHTYFATHGPRLILECYHHVQRLSIYHDHALGAVPLIMTFEDPRTCLTVGAVSKSGLGTIQRTLNSAILLRCRLYYKLGTERLMIAFTSGKLCPLQSSY